MTSIQEKISTIDWATVTANMNNYGYALVENILSNDVCDELAGAYSNTSLYRKTITMERYRFGQGEYKYFDYPLPPLLQSIRETIYPNLSRIANGWMNNLKIEKQFPDDFMELQNLCKANNQTKPTVLILKYGEGGHNTLHRYLYGDVYFPIQLVLFLSKPGEDYTGGEFVLLQQTPRAQSKAIVLQPGKGDTLLFTTNFRPAKGSKGYYRVNMKHGVSEVHTGKRYTLGIIFHDAL